MTTNVKEARQVSAGNGVTVLFPVLFTFELPSDLVVTLVDSTTLIETTQVLTTNYTVSGGEFKTGDVAMVVAPPTGTSLVIERSMPYKQDIDYQRNDPFPAEVNENGLDRATMLAQQNLDKLARAVQVPKTRDPTLAALTVPEPVGGEVLAGKIDLSGWESKSLVGSGTIAIPVPVTEGGTGAITASLARAGIGSTTVGDALFIAADTEAARTTINFDEAAWLTGQMFT